MIIGHYIGGGRRLEVPPPCTRKGEGVLGDDKLISFFYRTKYITSVQTPGIFKLSSAMDIPRLWDRSSRKKLATSYRSTVCCC